MKEVELPTVVVRATLGTSVKRKSVGTSPGCSRADPAFSRHGNPWRLDLDWRWCARGLELGCLFSIKPDAHSTDEIDNIQWGVLMARKGAVPKDRVLNTMSLAQFDVHLGRRKESQTARPKRPGARKHA
jgi:DNA polymerase (family X)